MHKPDRYINNICSDRGGGGEGGSRQALNVFLYNYIYICIFIYIYLYIYICIYSGAPLFVLTKLFHFLATHMHAVSSKAVDSEKRCSAATCAQ